MNQFLKSFSGKNNSLKPPVFGFYGCLPHDLERYTLYNRPGPGVGHLEKADLIPKFNV